MSDQKEFPQGIIFKLPHDKAPEFVKGSLSIKRKELIDYLNSKSDEWLNYDLKVSKAGKSYIDINDFKPDQNYKKDESNQQSNKSNQDNSLPF